MVLFVCAGVDSRIDDAKLSVFIRGPSTFQSQAGLNSMKVLAVDENSVQGKH
jgi:hypothetical protein